MTTRIQRKRSKGWRLPAGAVCVTRPGPFGNPFRVGVEFEGRKPITKREAALMHSDWIQLPAQGRLRNRIQRELKGKKLACWCAPGKPCHADVLIEIANTPVPRGGGQ